MITLIEMPGPGEFFVLEISDSGQLYESYPDQTRTPVKRHHLADNAEWSPIISSRLREGFESINTPPEIIDAYLFQSGF